ncbi:MAG: threonine ammonia-lyase [Candidatus Gastranaerophilales bacterium]|nr:threonine ammonia-lyase [Candidatus Gastranaerophilales bacterium]
MIKDLAIEEVKKAKEVLSHIARKTNLIHSASLSKDNNIYLKSENLQLTGSFKLRGAYYKISKLTAEQKKKGVIACSAGNHAQGVALAARENNIKATIFIPATAPISKVEATKSYGADVKLIDGVYDDAYREAVKFQEETGGIFVHPFNDIDVIAGQGTIALEIMEQLDKADAIVVPIGGGGLISGIAATIKHINPDCKVYGVQAQKASSMYRSIEENKRIELSSVNTFADGTAVKLPGELTFEYCQKYVDSIVTVSEDEIAAALLTLMEKEKIVSEGSGALPVAAVMFNKIPLKGKNIVCVVSGGNIDVNILSRVINRALLKTGRISNLTIELLDKPGQLRDVSTIIANLGANVIRVRHNQGGEGTDINDCYLKLTMETRDFEHFYAIKNALVEHGYNILSTVQ